MLYLLDLDGTLREPLSGHEFAQHPKDYKIIDGVYEAIDRVGEWPDNRFWGVSNQGGVAAGRKTLDDCFAEMVYTLQLAPFLETIVFCPDYEGAVLWVVSARNARARDQSDFYPGLAGAYRKPGAGALKFATRSTGFDGFEHDVVMVGDRPEDEEAAAAAGVNFISAESWRSGAQFLPGGSVVC